MGFVAISLTRGFHCGDDSHHQEKTGRRCGQHEDIDQCGDWNMNVMTFHICDFSIFFHHLLGIVIPTDSHSIIFQRGRSTTNQIGYPYLILPLTVSHQRLGSINLALAPGVRTKRPWSTCRRPINLRPFSWHICNSFRRGRTYLYMGIPW